MFKKGLKAFLLLVLVVISYFGYETYRKLDIITGYTSKYMCSCLFVEERKAEDVQNFDISNSPVSWAKHEIDYDKKKVTSTVWGLKANTSIFREGFGCALIADSDEQQISSLKFPNISHPSQSTQDTLTWPIGNKIELTEKEVLLQTSILNAIEPHFLNNGDTLRNTVAMTVVYDGKLIAEKYKNGFDKNQRIIGWSMTKSINSTLMGILNRKGQLNQYDKAPVQEWENDGRKEITIDNLLKMSSGLKWFENYESISDAVKMLYQRSDMYNYAIQSELEAKPGTKYYYSSGTSNILSGILKKSINNDTEYWAFPYKELFHKIGMYSMVYETDASGTYAASSYCYATPRDWSRYGLLYYNNGIWQGDTIVTPEWVDYTRTGSEAAPFRKYGAQWWVNGKNDEGELWLKSLPEDTYFCDGFQGQRIFVIPSKKVVITRFGKTFNTKRDFDQEQLVNSILTVLPE